VSEICITLHEIVWIKLKLDWMVMQSSPDHWSASDSYYNFYPE